MKMHIDVMKFVFALVAVVLAVLGLVSWWVVLLFVLYSLELKFTFDI